ncbi:phage protease [Zavarzinia sp.]|uniref:phage protease n=1 Tax=Zavarzinia sp. TaxID=2027920 RepID=UPI003565F734
MLTLIAELPQIIGGKLPDRMHLVPIGRWFDARRNQWADLSAPVVEAIYSRLMASKTDLQIDWRHLSVTGQTPDEKRVGGKAAAWIPAGSYELLADGIWGLNPRYTAEGAADVASGQYRYLSPVIADQYPDRITGQVGPQLINAALTNSPLLDGIKPLLAEAIVGLEKFNIPGGNSMEKIKAWLKARGRVIADNADEAALIAELDALVASVPAELAKGLGRKTMTIAEAVPLLDQLKIPAVPVDLAKAFGRESLTVAEAVTEVLKLRDASKSTDDVKKLQMTVAEMQSRERGALLDAAIDEGRLTVAERGNFEALLLSSDSTVVAAAKKLLAERQPSGPAAPKLKLDAKAPDAGGINSDALTMAEAFAAEFNVDPALVKKNLKGTGE